MGCQLVEPKKSRIAPTWSQQLTQPGPREAEKESGSAGGAVCLSRLRPIPSPILRERSPTPFFQQPAPGQPALEVARNLSTNFDPGRESFFLLASLLAVGEPHDQWKAYA